MLPATVAVLGGDVHRAAKLLLICSVALSWAWGQEPSPAIAAPSAPSAVQTGSTPGLLPTRTSLQDLLRRTGDVKPQLLSAQAETQNTPGDNPQPQQPPASDPAGVGVQLAEPGAPGQTTPPVTITFHDALARASRNYAQYLSAITDAKVANQDRAQARDAMLPSLNYSQQY